MLTRLFSLFALLLAAILPATAQAQAKAPTEAPAFSLETPQGETVNFPAAAEGRPTVLMFWPSWCPFSRALQPYVQNIWEDYRTAGVNVWTINIREDKDPVAVMKQRGLSFPLLIAGDAVSKAYRIQYTPWLVVVDGGNRIVYTRPPKPPTPVDTAREVRAVLNGLLGAKAVPLPASYPKPYDLHLKSEQDLGKKLAPQPIAAGEWGPWVERYLAGIGESEMVQDLAPRGAVADGKGAIALAREVWSESFGAEQTLAQAPYRSYRKGNRWVVLASGEAGAEARLGEGFICVIEADTGRVLRIAPRQ
ncbi:MAG: TlpA disulfide reductase family protein [Pseudomonadota bacterium]